MVSEMKMMARHRREQMDQSSSSTDEEDAVIRRKRIRKKSFPQKKGMTFALTSGVFAAFAGTFGKLAMNQTETVLICEALYFSDSSDGKCEQASMYLRVGAFFAMILLNTVMWTTFVKALRYCNTSLEATVTNTAANFFSSAIIGNFLFDELVSLMYCFGTVLIIFGLLLMNYGSKSKNELKERRKKFKSR